MLWYGEDGKIRELASLGVPAERIVDLGRGRRVPRRLCLVVPESSGTAVVGALHVCPRGVGAKIQHLGNEAGLPGVEDVERAMMEFK